MDAKLATIRNKLQYWGGIDRGTANLLLSHIGASTISRINSMEDPGDVRSLVKRFIGSDGTIIEEVPQEVQQESVTVSNMTDTPVIEPIVEGTELPDLD